MITGINSSTGDSWARFARTGSILDYLVYSACTGETGRPEQESDENDVYTEAPVLVPGGAFIGAPGTGVLGMDAVGTGAPGMSGVGAGMSGMDAVGADISGTDAVRAGMSGTDAVGADMQGTDAVGTGMSGTDAVRTGVPEIDPPGVVPESDNKRPYGDVGIPMTARLDD